MSLARYFAATALSAVALVTNPASACEKQSSPRQTPHYRPDSISSSQKNYNVDVAAAYTFLAISNVSKNLGDEENPQLSEDTRNIQEKLNNYYALVKNIFPNRQPLKEDGAFGEGTAKEIIAFAEHENRDEILTGNAMSSLQDKLVELAPADYAKAVRQIANYNAADLCTQYSTVENYGSLVDQVLSQNEQLLDDYNDGLEARSALLDLAEQLAHENEVLKNGQPEMLRETSPYIPHIPRAQKHEM